jgi:2-hydroxy-3-oxopropionate reductase
MAQTPVIGYIGLGLMGKPMARNLLKAGYKVVVHNRSQSVVKELVAEGAAKAGSPREVAELTEIVFTNLPDSPDVEAVTLGSNGLIEGVSPGMILIDNSTIKPSTARNIAEIMADKNVDCLDAPVSGGDIGAINGTLTIMVGGSKQAFDRVLPILQAVGKSITHIGDAGTGQITKCANQIMVAAQMVAMGELLILAKKSGADPEKVTQAIKGGAAQCWTLDVKTPRLFEGNRQPGFKAYMQAKDLGIVMDTARQYGIPLPGTAANTQLFNAMLEMDMAELDNSAVIGVIETLAGQQLLEE